MSDRPVSNDTVRLSRIEDKLDELATIVSSGFGELKSIPQRVQNMEAAIPRIDSTVAALVGTTTRQELRADKLEDRLGKVEQVQAVNLPRFEALLKDVPEVNKEVQGLKRSQTLVEGGWMLGAKIMAALGGASGLGAFLMWLMERAR